MAAIITKGTTPDIVYKFKTVDVSTLTKAIFTIKEGGSIVITKDLNDAQIVNNSLVWTLSQAETLSLTGNQTEGRLNWMVGDKRSASKPMEIIVDDNHIEVEI